MSDVGIKTHSALLLLLAYNVLRIGPLLAKGNLHRHCSGYHHISFFFFFDIIVTYVYIKI